MKTIVTYDKSSVSAKDDAVLYNALSNNNRLLTNMSIYLKPSNVLSFDDGYMLISGRVIKFNNESINPNLNISDSNIKGFIILTIKEESDILPENAVGISTSITPPILKQDNINISGGIFQIIIGEYTTNRTSISSAKLILENSLNLDIFQHIGVPVGGIIPFCSLTVPLNWMACDGRLLEKSVYPELSDVIQTQFGSTNSTNFKLPDLRAKTIFGYSASDVFHNSVGSVGGVAKIDVSHDHDVGLNLTTFDPMEGKGIAGQSNYTGPMRKNASKLVLNPYLTLNYIIRCK